MHVIVRVHLLYIIKVVTHCILAAASKRYYCSLKEDTVREQTGSKGKHRKQQRKLQRKKQVTI